MPTITTETISEPLTLVGYYLDEPERADTLLVLSPDATFVVEAVRNVTGLKNLNHAANYARYLMREGAEPVNERSHMNHIMVNGMVYSASGRESFSAHQQFKIVSEWMGEHFAQVRNEVCLMWTVEGVAEASIELSCFPQILHMGRILGEDFYTNNTFVTHFDQEWKGSPAHWHRSLLPGQNSFFEQLIVGLILGRVVVDPQISDKESMVLFDYITKNYVAHIKS